MERRTPEERQRFARESAERAEAKQMNAAAVHDRVAARGTARDEALIRREVRHATDTLARLERDEAGDPPLDDPFMREQIASMLREGWSMEELESVGVTREMLSSLGILHHLREG